MSPSSASSIPHFVALEARQANLEGAGGVGLDRLLREALRMRPDRLVLGECRGGEIRELLGGAQHRPRRWRRHLHANSLDDVPARLEALGALAAMSPETVARQAVSAIGLVLHLERRGATRRLDAVGRFGLDPAGRLRVERRLMADDAQAVEAVASVVQRLAVMLGAGVAPANAWRYLRDVDPSPYIDAVTASIAAGASIPAAIAAAAADPSAERTGSAWRAVAAAWFVASESGAPLAATLREIADSLRQLGQLHRDVDAALAGPRSTARFVGVMPLLGLVVRSAPGLRHDRRSVRHDGGAGLPRRRCRALGRRRTVDLPSRCAGQTA